MQVFKRYALKNPNKMKTLDYLILKRRKFPVFQGDFCSRETDFIVATSLNYFITIPFSLYTWIPECSTFHFTFSSQISFLLHTWRQWRKARTQRSISGGNTLAYSHTVCHHYCCKCQHTAWVWWSCLVTCTPPEDTIFRIIIWQNLKYFNI